MSRKKLFLLYFFFKFSKIDFGEGGCGDFFNDIFILRVMVYFKRCIEEYVNVIVIVLLFESFYQLVIGLYKRVEEGDLGSLEFREGGGEVGIFWEEVRFGGFQVWVFFQVFRNVEICVRLLFMRSIYLLFFRWAVRFQIYQDVEIIMLLLLFRESFYFLLIVFVGLYKRVVFIWICNVVNCVFLLKWCKLLVNFKYFIFYLR